MKNSFQLLKLNCISAEGGLTLCEDLIISIQRLIQAGLIGCGYVKKEKDGGGVLQNSKENGVYQPFHSLYGDDAYQGH